MTTIRLINDNELSETDFVNVTAAVAHFVPLITKAWNLPAMTVVGGGITQPGDWIVNITEQKRIVGASGYHEDVNGIPVAYVSYKSAGRIYGTYLKPMQLLGKIIHPAIYSEGVVTVICHEIAEMLCDPQVNTYSKPDAQGREWLIEVCDHVFGSYSFYTVNGQVCVLPDITTPNYYKTGSQAPYSLFGGAVAPFTLTKAGYGYYKDNSGTLQRL